MTLRHSTRTPRRRWQGIAGILVLLHVFLSVPAFAEQITIFAASSLKESIDELAAAFEEQSGTSVAVSYAGSAQLARQIAAGAPADVFLSANPDWMDRLDAQGMTRADTRVAFASNQLVLVEPADAPNTPDTFSPSQDLAQMLERGPLAMAFVDAVPAGIYGKAALETLDLWDIVQPHVVQTDSVRLALALVALGEAPIGIVYASDALAEPKVRKLWTFPADSHPQIQYVAAATSDRDASRRFLSHLIQPQARKTLEQHGFIPLNAN